MELFACSGPSAGTTISRNVEIAHTHAAVAGGLLMVALAVAALGLRRWAVPALLAGLVALHPAWTISAISGDCGYFKRDVSWVFTGVGCVALCWQTARGLWPLTGLFAQKKPEHEPTNPDAARDRELR